MVIVSALVLTGCSPDTPKLEAISGQVSLRGGPMSDGMVVFLPTEAQGTGTSARVIGGDFRIPKELGLMPGIYRVEISSRAAAGGAEGTLVLGKERVPKKYNVESVLTAEVKLGGPNEYTFTLD